LEHSNSSTACGEAERYLSSHMSRNIVLLLAMQSFLDHRCVRVITYSN